MDRLLTDKRAQGEFDSTGTFSIDPQAAREKIARFGLAGPDQGLLKLIQLAVAARSEALTLRLGRDSIELYALRPKGKSLTLRPMAEALSAALLACLYSGYESGRAADSNLTLDLRRDGFSPGEKLKAAHGVTRFVLKLKARTGMSRLRELIRGRTLNYTTLLARLHGCPTSLKLDGRDLLHTRPAKVRSHALDLFMLGPPELRAHCVAVPGEPDWKYRHRHVGSKYHRYIAAATEWNCFSEVSVPANPELFSNNWSVRQADACHCLGHLWVPLSKRKPGQLHFVLGGIIVDSLSWSPGWPVCGYVSAVGLDLDASGLRLVRNSKFEDWLESLAFEVTKAVRLGSQHTLTSTLHQCYESLG